MTSDSETVPSPLRRAKRPRSVLAGPYGHPFHALAVTIPIGAWTASIVFDVLGLITGDIEPFTSGAAWLVVIGIVGAAIAITTGLLDFSRLTPGTRAYRMALAHLMINLIVTVLFVVGAVVRFAGEGTDERSGLGIGLSVVGLVLLGLSGFLGGELVYRYGVRVADEDDQAAGHVVHGRR